MYDDNYKINTIFSRKRGDNHIVYIEYETEERKIKQIKKGSFKSKIEANNLVKELKHIYSKNNIC